MRAVQASLFNAVQCSSQSGSLLDSCPVPSVQDYVASHVLRGKSIGPWLQLLYCWHGGCRIDQLLEQVDQGSQVVAVDPIQIAEDIAIPRRDSDLTAWVSCTDLFAALEDQPVR